jgi:transposase InsO family protein
MGATMEATLVLEALNRALGQRQIEPDQLLVHTDQGGQYRATAYRQRLVAHQISCSMSAKGSCWDNAVVESFFSTLKHELDLDDDAETPSARKVDASSFRPLQPSGGLMESIDASLQRGCQS